MTSLEYEVQQPRDLPSLEAVAHEAARQFGMVFGEEVLAVESLEALRSSHPCDEKPRKDGAPSQGATQEFPAEDTPLRVPAEVERLRNSGNRPIEA